MTDKEKKNERFDYICDIFDSYNFEKISLYPYFDFTENGLPVFKTIDKIERIINRIDSKSISEMDLKLFIRYYSFPDYFLNSTLGVHVSYLYNNGSFNIFCRNKLLNNTNAFYYDYMLSQYTESLLEQLKESKQKIISSNKSSYEMSFPSFDNNFAFDEDAVKDEIIQKFLKNTPSIYKRLRYNYIALLFYSYIKIKRFVFDSEDLLESEAFGEIFSEMWQFFKNDKAPDINKRLVWLETQETRIMYHNVKLLVLFESLRKCGLIKDETNSEKIFGDVAGILPRYFKVCGKKGEVPLNRNTVDKIKEEIRERGDVPENRKKKQPYDPAVLKEILDEIIDKLSEVEFNDDDVYKPIKKRK